MPFVHFFRNKRIPITSSRLLATSRATEMKSWLGGRGGAECMGVCDLSIESLIPEV